MNVDLRYIQQSGNSGLRQANPGAFTQPFAQMAQTGRNLQWLGQKGAEFASAQQALANDNLYNEGLLNFTGVQAAVELDAKQGVLQPDGTRRRVDPDKLGIYTQGKLAEAQKKIVNNLPATRRAQFLKQTNNAIISSTKSAALIGTQQIQSRAKGLDIQFKNAVMNNLATMTPEQIEERTNQYKSRLARGVLTNTYSEEDSVKLLVAFQKELALTKLGQDASRLINSPDTTTAQLKQHLQAIDASPLPPKDKPQRKNDFINSMATLRRQREAEDTKIAKEVEESAFAYIAMHMPDENVLQQSEDAITIEFVRHLVSLGIIKDSDKINSYMRRLETIYAKTELPDGFEEKDALAVELQDIKSAVLKPDILVEDANAVLDVYEKQVRELTAIAPFQFSQAEASQLLKEVNTFRTAINDRKTRLEEQAIEDARKEIEELAVGNPLVKQFTAKDHFIARDAKNTVEMLVRSGMNPKIAVEKTLAAIDRKKNFADDFDADKAAKIVKEAFANSPRDMTEDQITLLEMLVKRNKQKEVKTDPNKTVANAHKQANQ